MSRKLEVQDRLHVELNEEVFFAPKLMQADEFPSGAREGEIRGFVTDVQRRGPADRTADHSGARGEVSGIAYGGGASARAALL